MIPPSPAHADVLRWPSMGEYLALKRTRRSNVGRLLKTAWLYTVTFPLRPEFERAVAGVPEVATVLQHNRRLYLSAFDCGFDVRLGARARFRALAAGLQAVVPRLLDTRAPSVGLSEWMVWCDDASGCSVRLGTNRLAPQEGIWMLSLFDGDGVHLFMLSFTVVGDVAYIGSVHGAVREEEGRDRIRQLTKALHGLRPHHALLEVCRALMQAWSVPRLEGIDAEWQVKAADGSRARDRVHFDYRALWSEAGGQAGAQGYWHLPLQAPRRPLEDIDARKRAMYRRRYTLLDDMTDAVARDWRPVDASA